MPSIKTIKGGRRAHYATVRNGQPEQALKAITLDGAWQCGEEDSKGSISPGKWADMVVLSDNPLTVDSMAIKDIRVLATYKEGRQIYAADEISE